MVDRSILLLDAISQRTDSVDSRTMSTLVTNSLSSKNSIGLLDYGVSISNLFTGGWSGQFKTAMGSEEESSTLFMD